MPRGAPRGVRAEGRGPAVKRAVIGVRVQPQITGYQSEGPRGRAIPSGTLTPITRAMSARCPNGIESGSDVARPSRAGYLGHTKPVGTSGASPTRFPSGVKYSESVPGGVMASPEDGLRTTLAEIEREGGGRGCRGDIKRCRLAVCPYLERVRDWSPVRSDLHKTNV